MIDLYLRADTEADLAAALPFARGEDEEGDEIWMTAGEGWALDIIGPLVLADGACDEAGNEIEPPVVDGRFHANLRCTEDIAALVPDNLKVQPTEPKRVWA